MSWKMLIHNIYFFCLALCSGQNSCEDGGICVDDTTPGQAVCVCRQLGTFCTGNCSGTYEFIMEGNQSCSGKKGSLAVRY